MKLSNLPPKGMYDWFPKEYKIRKYIFDTWRSVCTSYGYEEYLTPTLENADVYRAKSGEDIGGKELMVFKDKVGRELALRPEMTPSVTRMLSRKINELPKPIRYFSIANFFRNEKPQKGRNREFWQLNFDIFGDSSLNADLEVLQIAIEIMLAFNPPKGSFKLFINNRKLIDYIVKSFGISDTSKVDIIRTLDKIGKISKEDIEEKLLNLGIEENTVSKIYKIFSSENEELFIREFPEIEESDVYKDTLKIFSFLESLGYSEYVEFKPSLMRGFDYYDGLIFEVFDTNKENPRAMFGGGRYNGLSEIFGVAPFSAVGAAPGDETLRLFIKNWNLEQNIIEIKEDVYFLPVLDKKLYFKTLEIAKKLRKEGKVVVQELNKKSLRDALDTANKRGYKYTVIFGEYELKDGVYKIKNMESGEENSVKYS